MDNVPGISELSIIEEERPGSVILNEDSTVKEINESMPSKKEALNVPPSTYITITNPEGQEELSDVMEDDPFAVYMIQRMRDMLNENDMDKIVENQDQMCVL
ncbi:11015_t:CDS:2 [Acaulospora colombiana]|uniref:11015_t:CDS:1 n=1 Tax=Acaulospora colombiana TaxID=27376 RepID=A0ACA9M4T1_9GLOM|nr:11015_t:CDS:2 [Acaulospora colombiana]